MHIQKKMKKLKKPVQTFERREWTRHAQNRALSAAELCEILFLWVIAILSDVIIFILMQDNGWVG